MTAATSIDVSDDTATSTSAGTSASTDTSTSTSVVGAESPEPFECPADHPGEWVSEAGANDVVGDGYRFVVLNHRRYDPDLSGRTIPEAAVGDQVAEVCFDLTDMRFEPGTFSFESEADWPDGDAFRVSVGTPIHAIVGGDPMLRLAVSTIDGWLTFEVGDVENAATASEVIDLGGSVAEIVVYRWEGDVELLRIDDPAEVASLIDALRGAPLRDEPFPAGEPALSIDLVRRDGTITRRFVDTAHERLSPRIELPSSWTAVLRAAENAS